VQDLRQAATRLRFSSAGNHQMRLVRLQIREFGVKEGWTLKKVSDRSGVPYSTIKTYAVSPGMVMADLIALMGRATKNTDKIASNPYSKRF
jgi:putative transcriptional regulator